MIRKVTEQHRKDASKTPVYKVVRVEKGGRLRSLWVTGTKESPQKMIDSKPLIALTYSPNRVISNGRYGIWCTRNLGQALNQARHNGSRNLCKIYKVYPIGEPITPPVGWSDYGTVLYPAVIMGSRCIKTIDRR